MRLTPLQAIGLVVLLWATSVTLIVIVAHASPIWCLPAGGAIGWGVERLIEGEVAPR